MHGKAGSYRRLVWMVPLVVVAVVLWPRHAGEAGEAQAHGGRLDVERLLRGRVLVLEHGCGDCHGGGDNPAAPGFLDGMRDTLLQQFVLPAMLGGFRTRARNLTPDNETGLGRFTERQIFNALRFGLRPGETPDAEITSRTPGQGNFPQNPKYLAPPMPWTAWRHMPDQDIWDIAYYLKNGLKPSSNRVPDSEGPPDFWAGLYAQFAGPYPPPAFPTANEKAPQ